MTTEGFTSPFVEDPIDLVDRCSSRGATPDPPPLVLDVLPAPPSTRPLDGGGVVAALLEAQPIE